MIEQRRIFECRVIRDKVADRAKKVSIPAPPAALAKVIRIAGDPDRSLRDLGRVCSQEPGLTIELLRIANSARYSSPGTRIRNVPQAVIKLGGACSQGPFHHLQHPCCSGLHEHRWLGRQLVLGRQLAQSRSCPNFG